MVGFIVASSYSYSFPVSSRDVGEVKGVGGDRGRISAEEEEGGREEASILRRARASVSCTRACIRRQDRPRRLGSGGRKAAGQTHPTEDNKADVHNLLFAEEGSAASPVLSPPIIDNDFDLRKATEYNVSENAEPSPPPTSWRL